ncbi:hypothetical protein ACRTDR_09065 [Shewanella algae]
MSKNQQLQQLKKHRNTFKSRKAIDSALFDHPVLKNNLRLVSQKFIHSPWTKTRYKSQKQHIIGLTLVAIYFIDSKNIQLSQNTVDKFVGNTGEIGE